MSTYIIGDVHGCYDELVALLSRIQFDPVKDHVVFVGDLVNRGPKSLEVLRYVRSLGSAAQVVLGNHDVSLIAYASGVYSGKGSSFPEIIKAPDAPELIGWLRQQPLMIKNESLKYVVVHAAVPPEWSLETSLKHASKVEERLRGKNYVKYLQCAYRSGSNCWSKDMGKYNKFRYRLNGFTRLRYCTSTGQHDFSDKKKLGSQRKDLLPWFSLRKKEQQDKDYRLLFGHWAALGFHRDDSVFCIDTGCVWGGELTALKIKKNDVELISVASHMKKKY